LTKLTRTSSFKLEVDRCAVVYGRRRFSITRKACGLLALLIDRRLAELDALGSGSVYPEDIATMREWRGTRSSESLRSQIRREIKNLESQGIKVISCGTKMKGPFRLIPPPLANIADNDLLKRITGAAIGERTPGTYEDALRLSTAAEPLWRGMCLFDRKGADLPSSLGTFQQAENHPVPFVRALSMIQSGKTLRELSRFEEAMEELQRSVVEADNSRAEIRSFLRGSIMLEMAWVEYRRRNFGEAERLITEGLRLAGESGQARLLGDVRNMRALLYRRQRKFKEALAAHYAALEYWLLSGHFYGIQSFYHNLACLCADQAKALSPPQTEKKRALTEAAIRCAESCIKMCKALDIGQNSKLTELLLADLYAEQGNFKTAIQFVARAWRDATKTESRYEAAMAAYTILKLRLWQKQYPKAEHFLEKYCGDNSNARFIHLLKAAYAIMLKQMRSGHKGPPSASRVLNTL
jgi:tetratricopeptide (TPR) repeat protein